MVNIIADNILSPLGETTADNLRAVRDGRSALREHRLEGVPEPCVASLFELPIPFEEGLERTIRASLADAASRGIVVDAASSDVIFIVSSTKGNVAQFERIGASAEKVARRFGNQNRPIVVSNACISGLSAQILAMRLLRAGLYRTAIVAGMDVQGKFIVSGFQSFKALSPEPCRPFDGDRCGLNLGEAAASMILSSDESLAANALWTMVDGAVRNDAVHISNPSRTGEGSLRAISRLGVSADALACISAHGTATLFNDEMEAAAIDRAGLANVPTFSLKGYYGHTMGAAGILETIITLHAVQEGWIPATRGYAEAGTSHEIRVTANEEAANPRSEVLKLLSGFGGCNAAVRFKRPTSLTTPSRPPRGEETVPADGNFAISLPREGRGGVLLTPADAPDGLTALYRSEVGDYPKFYKMDPLCKLGLLATERLLNAENPDRRASLADIAPSDDRAVVIFTRCGSLADDRAYNETICDAANYFPSPSVFVYTLANIVTGEIAIRNRYMGETSCYILEEKDWPLMEQIIATTFQDKGIRSVIGGWLDIEDERHFEAELKIWSK
ncbi:MAG: 3-oxoacyl-ACP synthase [Bacteroidales bacterium]|nr:3-oxoacyl-ACP synthase [Bacteroidales bacterium]